jgi:hypothetical protein
MIAASNASRVSTITTTRMADVKPVAVALSLLEKAQLPRQQAGRHRDSDARSEVAG